MVLIRQNGGQQSPSAGSFLVIIGCGIRADNLCYDLRFR